MEITNTQIELLRQTLNTSGLRHKVLANNIANVNTPGYKRQEVVFEVELAKALDRQEPSTNVKAKVIESLDTPERVDGNTVDIDKEIGQVSKNALLYQAAAQVLSTRLAALRSAVTGR